MAAKAGKAKQANKSGSRKKVIGGLVGTAESECLSGQVLRNYGGQYAQRLGGWPLYSALCICKAMLPVIKAASVITRANK